MATYFYTVRVEVLNGENVEMYLTDRSEEPTPMLNIAREQFKNILNTFKDNTEIYRPNGDTSPVIAVVLEEWFFDRKGVVINVLERVDILQEVSQ